MVCSKCKATVRTQLIKLGFHPMQIEFGEVELMENILSKKELNTISSSLIQFNFELIEDKRKHLIKRIKIYIADIINNLNEPIKIKLPQFLSFKLKHNFEYLNILFTEITGISIELYFMIQKIEKVKELIVYKELTISEIAYKLNFSNVSQLNTKFKKATGLTPNHYESIFVKDSM